jgi:hypothetical protein
MSVQVQVSQVIDRSVDKVFSFFAREHVKNHPRWDPDCFVSEPVRQMREKN